MGIADNVLKDTKNNIDKTYYEPLAHFSLTHHFKQLNAEGFLLYNSNDIVVPSTEVYKIRRALPSLRFFESSEGGHNLKCEVVEDKVVGFFE